MDDKEKAKAQKVMEGIRATFTRLAEQFEELDAIFAGDTSAGTIATNLVKSFKAKWENAHRGETYVPTWAKDISQMKRISRALEPQDILERIDQFLASRDRYYVEGRHSLGMFVSNVNRFAGRASTEADEANFLRAPVIGCSHSPRCKDDQEHTRRSVQANRR